MSRHERQPEPAVIEIVERRQSPLDDTQPVMPNEVRINGIPLLCPPDSQVVIHQIDVSDHDAVRVTLTLWARRVVIDDEPDHPSPIADSAG